MMFPAFLDTCVLFGQCLTDTLLSIAEEGAFMPYWSREVLDAMERNVLARRPDVSADAIHRRRGVMERFFPLSLIEGHEQLIPQMTNHPGDRHVLAACVHSPAYTLVTFNIKDFPAASTEPYGVQVVHPDDFLLDQVDLHPEKVRTAMEAMLQRNRMPPRNFAELAEFLTLGGVPRFAAMLSEL